MVRSESTYDDTRASEPSVGCWLMKSYGKKRPCTSVVSIILIYTEIAIKMLLDNGELTSKELFDRYIARPYSEGTSRSQCGQMMQLLPALGLADRTSRGSLALRKDSLIAKQLREVFSVAA